MVAGLTRLRLPGNVRYCTTRVSPFRFVKSTYTRWFRSKLGANAIDRRPCSSPAVVTCREMSRNGRDRSRPPCRTRITPRRSTTYRLPPCPVTYVGWSSPDITGCSRAASDEGAASAAAAASTPTRIPTRLATGRHATPPWYGFCHGRHSHRVAGRVAGGRSRRGARAPRNRARVQGLASGGGPRMLCNNLDPEVAEDPQRLVVYGGSGRAARSHEALKAIVATLLRLEDDETLLSRAGSRSPCSEPTPAPRACFWPTRSSCPDSPPGTSSAGSRPRGSRCSAR